VSEGETPPPPLMGRPSTRARSCSVSLPSKPIPVTVFGQSSNERHSNVLYGLENVAAETVAHASASNSAKQSPLFRRSLISAPSDFAAAIACKPKRIDFCVAGLFLDMGSP